MAAVFPASNAWVRTSYEAPDSELRRAKMHLGRNGTILLPNGLEYVRVLGRGAAQPHTTINGLLPNVSTRPEMDHASGIRCAQSGHVYMTRNTNASSAHVRMPLYMLIDHKMGCLAVIPPDDMGKTKMAADASVITDSPL